MKRIVLLSLLILIIPAFNSCNKDIDKENISCSDLYGLLCAEAQNTEVLYRSEAGGTGNLATKSTTSYYGNIDGVVIPNYLLKYVEIYVKPDNPNDWDELGLCNLLSQDNSLSIEEKEMVAKTIGIISFARNELYSIPLTKSPGEIESNDPCLEEYNRIIRQILMSIGYNVAGGFILSGLIGAEIICIISSLEALNAIENAGIAYIRCVEQNKN